MSGNESLMIGDAVGSTAPEIFALTDEQILGLEPEGPDVQNGSTRGEQVRGRDDAAKGLTPEGVSYRDEVATHDGKTAQAGVPVPQEPPAWLARELKDPWVGEEARELWEGVQRVQREAAAYREAFATPEDARALKEIYPGGVAEAKGAAERARELAEIDTVFFGSAGKPAEELRAGRTALVEKLYAQDPAAFREMVEAGVRILGGVPGGQRTATSEREATNAETPRTQRREVQHAPSIVEGAATGDGARTDGSGAQPGIIPHTTRDGAAVTVPYEVVSRYGEFERATNAELEKSVGGAIGRAMEATLPNLRQANAGREGQAPPLQERLRAAVREEVETALRSDASLGEQVARVLSGRRFDEAARAQVVRLIDARAQQLVPGAVRRVVGSWTQATLGARKRDASSDGAGRSGEERRVDRPTDTSRRTGSGDSVENRSTQSAGRSSPRGRVDYRKFSDEQILGM